MGIRGWLRLKAKVMFIISLLLIILMFISCQSTHNKESGEMHLSTSPISDIESQLEENGDTTSSVISESKKENPVEEFADNAVSVNYPQLSDKNIEDIIINTLPGSFLPVTNDNGSIKILYQDLDQNGFKDAFFLVVKNKENVVADFTNLSDVSQLLKENRKSVDFFLAVYLQLQGSMISMYRIPIGSGIVISDFSILSIKKGKIIPLGINISFQTAKGMNSEWIVFSSYNKFSLFSMRENISTNNNIVDIDNDNIIDIVEWEDGLEEGTGYETYLTWYRWNGREFREYQSTNIVRNLNGFLEQSRLYLSFEQMHDFFRYSLSTIDYKEYNQSKDNFSDWMQKIFRPVPGTEPDKDELNNCDKFLSITFPQIFENPFSPQGKTDRIFNINVRFVCTGGYSFIRTARISMNPNPFEKPQFSFYLE
jgi:hypothetical protein